MTSAIPPTIKIMGLLAGCDELLVEDNPINFANMIVGIEIAEYEPKD